jgi:hypothetical protein
VLAGTLIPIVSTVHLVVDELIGIHKPSPTNGHCKNQAQMRVLNDTSNLLEYLLTLHQDKVTNPHKITRRWP